MTTSKSIKNVTDVKSNPDPVRITLNKCDNYSLTILAIQAFIITCTWDELKKTKLSEAKFSIGRKMTAIAEKKEVTPDIVIQKTQDLGFIVEVKSSIPRDKSLWEKDLAQCKKYDTPLDGWWYGSPENKNNVILIDYTVSAEFKHHIEKMLSDGNIKFDNPLALVEFAKIQKVDEYLSLRKQMGVIEDPEVNDALESGKLFTVEKLLTTNHYQKIKFSDHCPPVEYTMAILWQDYFTDLHTAYTYDSTKKAYLVPVSVNAITEEFQKLYGGSGENQHEVKFPRIKWIREALDKFVEIRWAEKSQTEGEYIIFFKKLQTDFLKKLTQEIVKKKSQKKVVGNVSQLALFD